MEWVLSVYTMLILRMEGPEKVLPYNDKVLNSPKSSSKNVHDMQLRLSDGNFSSAQ